MYVVRLADPAAACKLALLVHSVTAVMSRARWLEVRLDCWFLDLGMTRVDVPAGREVEPQDPVRRVLGMAAAMDNELGVRL